MHALKHKEEKRHYSKKDKQLMKLISTNAASEDEESEHELSYYLNDRVKMMKEVLKIIKPRKIKSMAPDCMKSMDIEEINSMLLEELLGISNKRLRYIFNGQNLNEESSSTDPEDQSVDIISLDDISDDDLIIDLDSGGDSKNNSKKHKTYIKEEHKKKKIKKEKHEKIKDNKNKRNESSAEANPMSEKNLMSVLELLELQARARAIRSQIVLESQKPPEPEQVKQDTDDDNDEDAVIVESPKNEEIVITSTDSENEQLVEENSQVSEGNMENAVSKNKIRVIQQTTINNGAGSSNSFWKNSDKNNTPSKTNDKHDTQITLQTSLEQADFNNSKVLIHNPNLDPKEKEEHVTDIPLPEILSGNESVDKLETTREVEISENRKISKQNESSEIQEEKEQVVVESKENCQQVKHRIKKDHKCKKLLLERSSKEKRIENCVDKTSNINTCKKNECNESSEQINDKILDEKKKNKRDSKHVCKRKKLSEEKKLINMDKNIVNNEESIVLNIDQDDMDCIYLE